MACDGQIVGRPCKDAKNAIEFIFPDAGTIVANIQFEAIAIDR